MAKISTHEDMINASKELHKNIVYLFHKMNMIYYMIEDLLDLVELSLNYSVGEIKYGITIDRHIDYIDKSLRYIDEQIVACANEYVDSFREGCSKYTIGPVYDAKFEEFYFHAIFLIHQCSKEFAAKKKNLDTRRIELAGWIDSLNIDWNTKNKIANLAEKNDELAAMLTNMVITPIGSITFVHVYK